MKQTHPWWIAFTAVVLSCVFAYFGSYLGEKAKGRAVQEGIEKFTHTVQGVRLV